MRLLPAVILALATVLAGCAQEPSQPASAKTLLPPAEAAARAWQADAALMEVFGVESANGTERAAPDWTELRRAREAHDDAFVGDGVAPAWQFTFSSAAANRSLDVVVLADGSVAAAIDRAGREEGPALASWAVDSRDAWAAAPEARGEAPRFAASYLVMQRATGGPVWELWTNRGHAFVDATDGTVVEPGAEVKTTQVGREWGLVRNTVSATSREHSFQVPLAGTAHERLVMTLALQEGFPRAQSVSLVLRDPTGAEALRLAHAVALGSEPAVGVVERPAPGNYTATVRLDDPAVLAVFEVTWCTDGEAGDMRGYDPEACRRLDE
jgi:hypothetical protein